MYIYIYMYIHIYTYIWRCPKIGLPLYKSSIYSLGFAMKTMAPRSPVLALRSQRQDGRRGHQAQTHRGGRGGGLG